MSFRFLDLLDDFLTERDALFTALSRANLHLTRFKLNYGAEGGELLAIRELGSEVESSLAPVRNRHPKLNEAGVDSDTDTDMSRLPRIMTKLDQVNELKTVYSSVLRNRLIPLTELLNKLNKEFE